MANIINLTYNYYLDSRKLFATLAYFLSFQLQCITTAECEETAHFLYTNGSQTPVKNVFPELLTKEIYRLHLKK